MYRRALAQIQHTVLDTGLVRGLCHLAAQGVQLPDQMALAGAADGGVAGHIAHGVHVHGKAEGVHAKACRGKGCLNAGMARADDRNITFSRVVFYHVSKFL